MKKTAGNPASAILFLVLVAVVAFVLAALFGLSPIAMVRGAGAAETKADLTTDKTAIVQRTIDDVFRPAYRDLATRAGEMARAEEALCEAPSEATLLAAREGFAGLVTAFSRIEFVRFGPIMEDNRIDRFLFWPDRRGVALRQVQALLAGGDETATTVEGLRAKSVAVQGLNALEFVLFGTKAETLAAAEGGFRCRYGAAIAASIDATSAEIAKGWDDPAGIAKAMTRPSPDSPAYREIDDSLDEILGTLVHAFEAIRDLRIKPAFGGTIAEANPKSWIYQRSELTEASLQANFAGLAELYDRSGIGRLLPPAERWMDASISFEFANAGRAFQTLGMPLSKAAGDPERRERVGYLLILTQSLQDLFANQFAPAVGLKAGFSSLDGD